MQETEALSQQLQAANEAADRERKAAAEAAAKSRADMKVSLNQAQPQPFLTIMRPDCVAVCPVPEAPLSPLGAVGAGEGGPQPTAAAGSGGGRAQVSLRDTAIGC